MHNYLNVPNLRDREGYIAALRANILGSHNREKLGYDSHARARSTWEVCILFLIMKILLMAGMHRVAELAWVKQLKDMLQRPEIDEKSKTNIRAIIAACEDGILKITGGFVTYWL